MTVNKPGDASGKIPPSRINEQNAIPGTNIEAQKTANAAALMLTGLPPNVATAIASFMLKSPKVEGMLTKLSPKDKNKLREDLDEEKKEIFAEEGFNIVSADETKGQGLNELS